MKKRILIFSGAILFLIAGYYFLRVYSPSSPTMADYEKFGGFLSKLQASNPGVNIENFQYVKTEKIEDYYASINEKKPVQIGADSGEWEFSSDGKHAFSTAGCLGNDCSSLDIYNRTGGEYVERLFFCGTPCFYLDSFWLDKAELVYAFSIEDEANLGQYSIQLMVFDIAEGVKREYSINNLNFLPKPPQEGALEPYKVILRDFDIPWDLAFMPDGEILISERSGRLVFFSGGRVSEVEKISTLNKGEAGLLGIAIHPNFRINKYIYLYMTQGDGGKTINKVVRYKYSEGTLSDEKVIIGGIPGAAYHDGGRIDFGPDGYLYVATGDASDSSLAQDLSSLAGKILRVSDDGLVPAHNPYGTLVYSYGHRNPQGLAWDNEGRLWSTEHGRSGILSGMDELNLIVSGANYGWPEIQGNEEKEGMVAPVINSGSAETWAPASVAFAPSFREGSSGSLFFGGLRGSALYEAVLSGREVLELKEHFKGEFGRIRTVRIGPDDFLYLATSNRDGRGKPREGDDMIIKIDPGLLNGQN